MDLAENGMNRKACIKGRGTEIFSEGIFCFCFAFNWQFNIVLSVIYVLSRGFFSLVTAVFYLVGSGFILY